jgi:glycosyltransferase involved in cell wall biosynthesis
MDRGEARVQVGKRYGLRERYVLAVGLLQPRKNLARLLEAFELIVPGHPDLQLVVVGARGWGNEPLHERLQTPQLCERVALCGSVPPEDLRALYSAAEMLVYPSLYEGFGLPPLEAMSCGTPVVASKATAVPEVVGDAGLLVDPLDPQDIAAAMGRILEDTPLAADLAQRGLARAGLFSWRATARRYLEVFHEVAACG